MVENRAVTATTTVDRPSTKVYTSIYSRVLLHHSSRGSKQSTACLSTTLLQASYVVHLFVPRKHNDSIAHKAARRATCPTLDMG